jgi:hypothetical protein
MRSGVPLMEDLHRMGAEPLLTQLVPAVPAIGQVSTEKLHRLLVVPDRRVRQALAHQRCRPLLDVARTPPPRVVIAERHEPANDQHPLLHRRRHQQPRPLLSNPPSQHRLQHRLLRRQERHTRWHDGQRRSRQLNPINPCDDHRPASSANQLIVSFIRCKSAVTSSVPQRTSSGRRDTRRNVR